MIDNILDILKSPPVEQCDPTTRKIIAKSLSQKVNELIPHQYSYDKRIEELNQNGFIQLNLNIPVYEIVNNLKSKQTYNAHVPYGDGIKRSLDDAKNFSFACYELNDIISCPHLLQIALNEEILNLAANYLECTPTLYSMNCWWSFPKPMNVTQYYHRDYDDYKFLALFIYLTDVTTKNGAHCFVKHSHNDKNTEINYNEKDVQTFVGKAGTTFLSDTFAIHKALPLVEGNRLVFWARYGLSRNGPSKAQLKYKCKKPYPLNDRLNYITRLILE